MTKEEYQYFDQTRCVQGMPQSILRSVSLTNLSKQPAPPPNSSTSSSLAENISSPPFLLPPNQHTRWSPSALHEFYTNPHRTFTIPVSLAGCPPQRKYTTNSEQAPIHQLPSPLSEAPSRLTSHVIEQRAVARPRTAAKSYLDTVLACILVTQSNLFRCESAFSISAF
jgi:hypothetical protein